MAGFGLSWGGDLVTGARLLADLPSFLRTPVGLAEARATVRRRLERREADFLELAGRAVYGSERSPYRRLLGPAIWLTIPAFAFVLRLERHSDTARHGLIAVLAGCGVYAFVMIAFFGGTGRHLTPALALLLGALLIAFARTQGGRLTPR